ncbi:hypothetical protein AVEN_75168-1 [Araneus ventricosus]|uniref:Uncharacterized protein n=1 Tax=Araneus ventricosus TaxID=182803 RepID=A0A4Y2V5W9_ARAVE|nr:hypothetical protein AVEN_75168-1 [Araneus ventricosus]
MSKRRLLSIDEEVEYLSLSDEELADDIDSDMKSSCNLSLSNSSTKDGSDNVEEIAEGDEAIKWSHFSVSQASVLMSIG